MKQGIKSCQFKDEQGRPAGGHTWGTGFAIAWQNGPLGRGEERKEPNGAFVEDVLDAVIDRIMFYEQETPFKCQEKQEALEHLYKAASWLDRRTKRREQEQTEGTHEGK